MALRLAADLGFLICFSEELDLASFLSLSQTRVLRDTELLVFLCRPLAGSDGDCLPVATLL